VHRGERTAKVIAAVVVLCATIAVLGWGVGKGVAEEEKTDLGKYQAVAPDLVLDTTTGRLSNSDGQVLEQSIDPSGTKIGRYSAAGYTTAVTRSVGLSVINQPVAYSETIKGYIVIDTQTGQVLKQRVYYRQPLQSNDF